MSPFPATEWIWADGKLVRWEEATVHVMSHVVHYGSSVFEGIRSYATPRGAMFFRFQDHVRRLRDSASIHRMALTWSDEQIEQGTQELLAINKMEAAYVRPVALRGLGAAGIDPSSSPVRLFIACWSWGAYLGDEGCEKGVDAGVSSWFRPAPNTHPTMAKAGGNYVNGSLMKMEAKGNGYDEAIALSTDGLVSEGSGQNIFLVKNGELHTPAVDGTFLQGITRDSVIRLAHDMGIPVHEGRVPREALYVADEVFFVGTASEVVPVRSVDRRTIGEGRRGPVTARLQDAFLAIVRGEAPDRHGWLTPALPAAHAQSKKVGNAAGVA